MSLFDPIDETHVDLSLNSVYWSGNRMNPEISKNDFIQFYRHYDYFCQSYALEKRSPLLQAAFKTHCLFVIDCSSRKDSIKYSTVDIKIDIEDRKDFPDDTKVFFLEFMIT